MKRDLTLAAAVLVVMAGALVAMQRVFIGPAWRPVTAAALLFSLGVVVGARRLGLGPVAALVGSLSLFSVFTYIAHLPSRGLLPGVEEVAAFSDLLREAIQDVRNEPAPTIALPSLLLLVSSGVWWVTYLVHELLVRLRRPGLALVPVAVLWAVPLSVPQPAGQTWPWALPFLAAAGLVLLLESETDLSGWTQGEGIPTLSRSGLAVGAVALTLAAAVPAVLPGYGEQAWVDVSGNRPEGYQPLVDVSNRLKLPVPRDVLEVRSDRRMYWRIAALDSFDGKVWRVGRDGTAGFTPESTRLVDVSRGIIPDEVPIQTRTRTTSNVRILDLENFYVPVPYQAVRVTGPDVNGMVYSEVGGFIATSDLTEVDAPGLGLVQGVVPGVEYTVTSELPAPSYEQLQATGFAGVDPLYTSLPISYPDLRAEAERIYAEVGATTAAEKAFAIQDYFAGQGAAFIYDTDVEALDQVGELEAFVLEGKRGYCEYFATAMAVMLRESGIPARVAVGFLGGTQIDDGATAEDGLKTYRIGTRDAHAWVEVLFPGSGWIRFEPTPRSDGRTQTPSEDEVDPLLSDRETALAEAERVDPAEVPGEDDVAPNEQNPDTPANAGGGTVGGGGDAQPNRLPVIALGLVGLVGIAGALVLARRRDDDPTHGVDPAAHVLAAQRRVHRTAERLGVPRRPSETTVETAQRWSHEGRAEHQDAQRLAVLGQAAAFGGDVTADEGAEADLLCDALVTSLRASVAPRDRALAPIRLPVQRATSASRSTVRRVTGHGHRRG